MRRYAAECRLGFTLVEMAVVLVILGLLLGGGISLLGAQARISETRATERTMQEVLTALRGFAAFNAGRLPCPDSEAPFDGREDMDALTGLCLSVQGEGWLPYATLGGIGHEDAWGGRLRYRVLTELARLGPDTTPTTMMSICRSLDVTGGCAQLKAIDVVAVLLSHGPNAHGGLDGTGAVVVIPATAVDETANTDGNAVFVDHEARLAGGVGGEFDDQVAWMANSSYQAALLHR